MKKAFTLAEVLITLAIIGIVAALTIPTLVANYQKKQWVTGLQKGYATLNNMFKLAMANDGVDSITQTSLWQSIPDYEGGTRAVGDQNMDHSGFIANLQKYMKIVKYDYPTGIDGFDICYKDLDGDDNDCLYNKGQRLRIYTQDGMIYYFRLDDQNINSDENYRFGNSYIFAGIIEIDVNGEKGPNQMGRDLFQVAVVNDGRVIFEGTKEWEDTLSNSILEPNHWSNHGCTENDIFDWGKGDYCGARIFENGWRMDY